MLIPNKRSHYNKKPAHATRSSPRCITREGPHINEDPAQPKGINRSLQRRSHVWFCDCLVWKPLGPAWTQMGSPALQAWLTRTSLHPWFLSWPLTPVPARSVPWQPCGVGADGLHLSPCSVTDHVTLAKLLSHRMGIMILPPHSGAGRTRVRVTALFFLFLSGRLGFQGDPLVAQMVKSLPAMQETRVQPLGGGRSPGEGNGILLQYSCLGNPMDGGAWQATVHGVTKSWTQLNGFAYVLGIHTSYPSHVVCPCPSLILIEA